MKIKLVILLTILALFVGTEAFTAATHITQGTSGSVDLSTPGPIGATTPAAGSFTDVTIGDDLILTTSGTDGKWCTYSTTNGVVCAEDAPAGSGDVVSVGDCASGACLDGSDDGGTFIKLWSGVGVAYTTLTAGSNSISLSSSTASTEDFSISLGVDDNTITFGQSTGTNSIIGLASYSFGAAGVKITGDGDGQITLLGLGNGYDENLTINLDDTENQVVFDSTTSATFTFSPAVTITGALTASTSVATPFVAIGTDPADAGSVRLPNAGYILSEADAAGTDVSLIGADSSEVVQIGASGASGVTITPAATLSGGFSAVGTNTVSNGSSSAGSIYFKEDSDNGTNTAQLIGPASTADVVITLPATTGTVALTGTVQLTAAPGSDHTYSGTVATMTAGENLTIGQLCYRKSDGKWWLADADAATTMPGLAMATDSISANATGVFLLSGFLRDDTFDWTVGGLVYAGSGATSTHTAGAINQAAPNGSGDQVQIIGYAYTADILYFNPSMLMLEL